MYDSGKYGSHSSGNSYFILDRRWLIGKYLWVLSGIQGKFLIGILACFGVLLPFFLLHFVHAVVILVQFVGDLLASFHIDFGIT
jgi:hypothetical protein